MNYPKRINLLLFPCKCCKVKSLGFWLISQGCQEDWEPLTDSLSYFSLGVEIHLPHPCMGAGPALLSVTVAVMCLLLALEYKFTFTYLTDLPFCRMNPNTDKKYWLLKQMPKEKFGRFLKSYMYAHAPTMWSSRYFHRYLPKGTRKHLPIHSFFTWKNLAALHGVAFNWKQSSCPSVTHAYKWDTRLN